MRLRDENKNENKNEDATVTKRKAVCEWWDMIRRLVGIIMVGMRSLGLYRLTGVAGHRFLGVCRLRRTYFPRRLRSVCVSDEPKHLDKNEALKGGQLWLRR